MARVRVSEEQAQAQYNRDLVDRATTLARQRALAMLGESPGESAFNSVEVNTRGDVPALIRAILATNSHGVTSVQIAKIAEEQGRPFQPVELHSTLSRMVRTGELIATGKPRERVYRLAAQKDSGKEGTTKGE
jgi:hypothetical protein